MPVTIHNPYSGKDDETCSVSFAAQQAVVGTVGSAQTEADYHLSQQLGEWGVITAKLKNSEVAEGTKVLAWTNSDNGQRGYFYVKGGKLWQKKFSGDKSFENEVAGKKIGDQAALLSKLYINSKHFDTSIPKAINEAPKASLPDVNNPFGAAAAKYGLLNVHVSGDTGGPVVWTGLKDQGLDHVGAEFLYHGAHNTDDGYQSKGIHVVVSQQTAEDAISTSFVFTDKSTGAFVHQQKNNSAKWWIEQVPGEDTGKAKDPVPSVTVPTPHDPIASPTPSAAVIPGSDSVGSMSDEDVSAMFVKIKDDLTKELGVNVKGANPDLDKVVYKAIGGKTGYTPEEVKAKIDQYKADGNKLSALKKKVMNGSKKVPDGKAQPTKASPSAPLNTHTVTSKPVSDPKPHDVPTVATPKLADEAKAEVKATVNAAPAKHYTDEDLAAQYIIAKDKVVAGSNGKWTLYTKDPDLEKEIYGQITYITGFNKDDAQAALANYLGSGKKLSVLKKQLAKQGAFTPQADTLKKSGKDKDLADKAKDVDAKADAGYTPVSTPATGTPPVDTGKDLPKAAAKADAKLGDIDGISEAQKLSAFGSFKAFGHQAWLSGSNEDNYEAFVKLQAAKRAKGEDYSILQLIRIVDEQGAKKAGAENGHLFEKKVATWLTSPAGTSHIKSQEKKKANLLKQAKAKEEAEKLARELEGNQPALPADSASFQEMTPLKALDVQSQQLRAKPFGPHEREALRHYTGNAYTAMNNHLRGLSTSIGIIDKNYIEPAQRGMRPSPVNMLLRRGTGARQFLSLGVGQGDTHLLWGLTGKTFKDDGFLSTSAASEAAFFDEVTLEVELPQGAPTMFVDNFSEHPGENEQLIQAGCSYKILNVRRVNGQFIVRMRVTDWPGKG